MNRTRRLTAIVGVALTLLVGAAVGAAAAGAVPAAQVFVFSNSSPHVSVIDAATRQVVTTADIPDFTGWAWNDSNNYFDGQQLWLGLHDPDTNDVEVIALDLDTLEVTHRLPLGTDALTLYIGKASRTGVLDVTKMASAQVVPIDMASGEVRPAWDVPVHGDVACDADVSTDAEGRERFVYPTRKGDTVVTLDPTTGEVLKEAATPAGTNPFMLTTAHDGTIWVGETGSNTVAVFDPELNLIKRVPSGKSPIDITFSLDGARAFVGHSGDTVVTVFDTASVAEAARIEVGTNPEKLAVDPGGQAVYAILTKEGAVAVIETADWTVADRIPLGTNPTGIFVRAVAEP